MQEKELTDELLQLTKEQKAKLWLGNLENQEVAKELGLDPTKPIKITMNGDAIAHIEKRHGKDSVMVKNGQPPIETQDYFKQIEVVNKADKRKIVTEEGQKKLISGKQVNGYFIVVETISTKNNELKLKTMYKENGKLENSREFGASKDHKESGGYSLSPKPSVTLDSQMHLTTAPTPSSKGYDLDRTLSGSYEADIIPQNPTKRS